MVRKMMSGVSTETIQIQPNQPTHRTPWRDIIRDVIEATYKGKESPEMVLENFAYAMQRHYPPRDFRIVVFSKDDGDHIRLIRQTGFPVTDQQFEELVYENRNSFRAYELTESARFVDEFDKEVDERRGNLFDEGRVAFIPILSSTKLHGWLILSSYEKGTSWSETEKLWLPLLGSICGCFASTVEFGRNKIDSAVGVARQSWIEALQDSIGLESAPATTRGIALPDPQEHPHENAPKKKAGEEGRIEDPRLLKLTSREREILDQVALGLTNNEISRKLFISEHTTKKHIENILSKLGVKNRTQAAKLVNESYEGGTTP